MSSLTVDVPEALQPLLRPARYKGAFGGRGGAKSHFYAEQLILRCFSRTTRAVCVREVQNSLKESVRQLLVDKIMKFGLEDFFQILDAEIRAKNGSLIIFKGMQSYNADSIKSLEGYDIAWVEEAQSLSHHSLRLLRPTIRKDDSELWFSWNPRHKRDAIDEFFRAGASHPNAICVSVNWQDNPWFPKELVDEKNFDYARDPEMADHVWGGNYEIVTEGAYYAKLLFDAEKNDRITNVPYEPEEPVYTAWDLGLDDSTAIWFAQIIGPQIRIIDYLEVRNVGLVSHPGEERPIVERVLSKPYIYAEHYLPHDVDTREISNAKTRKEQLEAVNLKPIIAGSKLPVEDGINAVRNMLPKCVFDNQKCEQGIDALRNYRTDYDEEKDINKPKPRHDWSSHGADAFRYMAVSLFDVRQAKHVPDNAVIDYNPFESPDSWVRDDRTSGVEDYNPW